MKIKADKRSDYGTKDMETDSGKYRSKTESQ